MNLDNEDSNLEQEFEWYAAMTSIAETLEESQVMPLNILDSLKSALTIIDGLKKSSEMVATAKNIELQKQLFTVEEALLNSEKEIRSLKAEVEELKKQQEEKLTFKHPGYYTKDGEGPFCPTCYDTDKKQMRLFKVNRISFSPIASSAPPITIYDCKKCNSTFSC